MMPDPGSLAATYRELYRARFQHDLTTGDARPFLVPHYLLGAWILPTLYLAVPHRNRPWLYHARWVLLAVATIFHIEMIRKVSSNNFAFAYGAGLLASWGVIWNFTLFVWTRPQFDAKRIENRYYGKPTEAIRTALFGKPEPLANGGVISENGLHTDTPDLTGSKASVIKPRNVSASSAVTSSVQISKSERNGDASSLRGRQPLDPLAPHAASESKVVDDQTQPQAEAMSQLLAGGDRRSISPEGPEPDWSSVQPIYWQEYPEDAPFLTRLDWSFDIASTLRLTGWNWAIPVLPAYRVPKVHRSGLQAPLSSSPVTSREGYTRVLTLKELLETRLLFSIIPNYLILDFIATTAVQDPYFVVGPSNLPLPANLAAIHPVLLAIRRSSLACIGIYSAIQCVFNLAHLAIALIGPYVIGFRADPYHLPTFNGSFDQVMDRGLAGFWGGWWHQSFRFGFAAPTKWMIDHGYIKKGTLAARVVGAVVAFVLSGFLHASGSYATIPESHWWMPPLFFLLSGVGTVLQQVFCETFKLQIERLPRWLRRTGNVAFVVVWLHLTSWPLIDDFGRCGLWLYEPVPVSIFRALGFGGVGDTDVWRWDRGCFPYWHSGKHWWDSGIAI